MLPTVATLTYLYRSSASPNFAIVALRLDPQHARARYWLAAIRCQLGEETEVPEAAPADYVTKLFDGYADK